MVSPNIQEQNGVWAEPPFVPAAKLLRVLRLQLSQPVRFEYEHGRVGRLFLPTGVSETLINIHCGILTMFQMTLKSTQSVYQLQEVRGQT